ncbi:MAG: type III secretion system export apparatus subunit SctR [Rhizobacter sp.]
MQFDPYALIAIALFGALLPFAAILATAYTKIVIVIFLLRQAMGLQNVPPNMVVNAMALVLTAFIMAPIGMQGWDTAKSQGSFQKDQLKFTDMVTVFDSMVPPLKAFLSKKASERDRRFFMKAATELWPKERVAKLTIDDLPILIPAFTVSELTEAFQIGFVLYLIFLVIDLIVANVLLAMGMAMISPTVISTPFKLLLFVMLDGWQRLIQSLVMSYR